MTILSAGSVVKSIFDSTRKGVLLKVEDKIGHVIWYETGWLRSDPVSMNELSAGHKPQDDSWVNFIHHQLNNILSI